jgi:hypothetical protein
MKQDINQLNDNQLSSLEKKLTRKTKRNCN